ncbi:MAG: hypothetical protein EPN39_11155 [Chitinophagaceae bacterium]|nr:MAG: hypothetical protein EPN39_11155 [Chitinophagaceae bacterium]
MNLLSTKAESWLAVVLFNLFMVAMAGLLLRAFHYIPIPHLNYDYLLQAHSHFAFGGWGFMALFIAFHHAFLNKSRAPNKSYTYIFLAALVSVYGMLISFPFGGYAAVSTSFSTLYIWVTYWFTFRFFRDTKNSEQTISLKMAKAALFLLIFSSIGPYTMAVMMASGHGGDPHAMNAIYFYLHFQYNGWFMFGILALFFKWVEMHSISFSKIKAVRFYRLLFWSCFPAVLLSFLWSRPANFVFWIAGLAGFIQLMALIPLLQIIHSCSKEINMFVKPVIKFMGIFILAMFILKYLLEFFGSIPVIVNWTITIRNLLIAYLHLVFLGVFTLFLLTYFIQVNVLRLNKITQSGLWIFLIGFFITEAILFSASYLSLHNNFIPSFNRWMFFTTLSFPLGIALLWIGNLKSVRQRFKKAENKISINDTGNVVKEIQS